MGLLIGYLKYPGLLMNLESQIHIFLVCFLVFEYSRTTIGVWPSCAMCDRPHFLFRKNRFSCQHLSTRFQSHTNQYCLSHIPHQPRDASENPGAITLHALANHCIFRVKIRFFILFWGLCQLWLGLVWTQQQQAAENDVEMTCQCCDGGSFGVQWEAATAEQTPAAGPGSDITLQPGQPSTHRLLLLAKCSHVSCPSLPPNLVSYVSRVHHKMHNCTSRQAPLVVDSHCNFYPYVMEARSPSRVVGSIVTPRS